MQISNLFKRIASIIILIAFIVVPSVILGNLMQPLSHAMYFDHDLDVIEAEGSGVDMVFLGTSRVYRTFVPEIIEKEMDMDCVINAATASQPICASYYQLEYLIKKFHPQNVVLGVGWETLMTEPGRQSRLIMYDRLKGTTRFKYAIDCFDFDEMLYLIDAYRFRKNFEINEIRTINERKKELVDSNYTLRTSDEEYYADKGFIYSVTSVADGNVDINGKGEFDKDKIIEGNLKYLDACIDLCEENDINVYMVTGPTTMMRIYYIDNYQDAVDYFDDYAREKGLIYHNLNYLKDRETILPDSMMFDYNHVNGEAAYMISELYTEILRKDMSGIDTSDYFYKDLDELKDSVNRIVAVDAEISIEASVARVEITSLQNDDVTPYYQVEISEDGEDYTVIVEWTKQSKLDLEVPGESGFYIKVRARTQNNEGYEAYQIYKFK